MTNDEAPRRRMLLFSFSTKPQLQTSVSDVAPSAEPDSTPCLPVMEHVLLKLPECHIFERLVQDLTKHEDYIPPALDALAHILGSRTNLDEVEMVYSRRNSLVLGLNMALGRPYTPLRKNSVYSTGHALLLLLAPQLPVSPPKLALLKLLLLFYLYADMVTHDEFARRPLMMHLLSGPAGRKLLLALAQLLSLAAFAKMRSTPAPGMAALQLSKQFLLLAVPQRVPLKRSHRAHKSFMISPELLDLEEVYYPALDSSVLRLKLVTLLHLAEESLVLLLIGDCLRQSTTEIAGQ